MAKVYLVSTGCYSDYHVLAIFSTREKAQQYWDLCSEPNDIEEFEIDREYNFPPGKKGYLVDFKANGEVKMIMQLDPDDNFSDEVYPDRNGSLFTRCWANSKEHAIKIANERRTRWLAMADGPTKEGKQ